MESIEVESLVKSYKGVDALKGISFSVPSGKILSLLGPNGSGKTTTVRILTTLISPDSGRVFVGGYDVIGQPKRVREIIGLAGQFAAVDEYLTGRENLEIAGRLYHLPRKEVSSRSDLLLEQFGLVEAANRPVKTYSGGMRRRLDLAVSLMHKPQILFLDEPTTGLDPQSRLDLWKIIEDLVASGTTLLLTTQYLEEADRLADDVVILDKGKIIAHGTPSELKQKYGSQVLILTYEDKSLEQIALNVIANSNFDAIKSVDGTSLEILLPTDDVEGVLNLLILLKNNSCYPYKFELREPTLDDAFLSLTGASQ